ncbi:ATP-binding cassette sub-family F member 1 isoform X2 [Colossoma macropomum]|nr:ATP-binding cassette sub-family F member 1 isoform X2 [Colossoma macropomum]
MDESTFETFEEELGTPLQDVHPQKPLRQARRTEMYTQRRVREEPPIIQQMPKAVPREPPVSRTTPLRKTLSLQNLAQIEVPWEGVTLNRCLFIAITILVLTSGCQKLNEVVRGSKDGTDVDGIGTALNMRHTLVKKGRLPIPQPETSLWDTFFWWVSDDNDEEEEGRRGRSRKATQERASRGLRHKAMPNRNLLKGRQDTFKARRGKARQNEEETKERVKAQTVKEKRLKAKKLKKEEQGEEKKEEEKKQKKKTKESKKKDTKKE